MSQVVSMVEAKSRLAELVGQVKFGGKQYILERRGRPMAMLISVEEYEQLRAQDAAAGLLASPLSPRAAATPSGVGGAGSGVARTVWTTRGSACRAVC